ncbi:MAG: glycoside hydrolase family 28 protein [Spirochaetaceae bacterium]|nr:glycoside hydrolase family 28 protein [Spirochaetaceae bacterium]
MYKKEFDIADFGAVGDGQHDNSNAVSRACKAAQESKGALIRIRKGLWRTGPLELFSNTTLHLDTDAVLSFIPEPERYAPVYTRWEGVSCYALHPLIFVNGQTGVTISGTGCIDGSGEVWWNLQRSKKAKGQNVPETEQELALAVLNGGYDAQPGGGGGRNMQFLRPPLLQFHNCSDICLEGVSIRNAPFWTVHPLFSQRVVIRGITITNPQDAPNTDGIDIDSCTDVLIEQCRLSVGDDGIALKSGSGEDGIRLNRPVQRVSIRHCTVENAHGGVVIGSETAGGIFDVTVEDCVFNGTDRGIRIKTRRGRGGDIRNLRFHKVSMENNLCPLAVNMFYRCGASLEDGFFSLEAQPVTKLTPTIKKLYFENIHATGSRASAGFIAGLPEAPIEELVIQNSSFATNEDAPDSPADSDMFLGIPPVAEKSFRLLNVKDPVFSQVTVAGPTRAFLY